MELPPVVMSAGCRLQPMEAQLGLGSYSSSGSLFVAVVKPAHLGQFDHQPEFGWLNRSGLRSIFAHRQMSPRALVIIKVGSQDPSQRRLVQDNDVVQAFAPYRSHKSFGIRVLPRRPWRG